MSDDLKERRTQCIVSVPPRHRRDTDTSCPFRYFRHRLKHREVLFAFPGGYLMDAPNLHSRRTIRYRGYDYTQPGAYFVTFCAAKGHEYFGRIAAQQMVLNPVGQIAHDCWRAIPEHHHHVQLDEFVIMPNHGHGIVSPGLQKRGCLECREGHNVLCPYRDAPAVGTRTIVSCSAKRRSAGRTDTIYRVLPCKSGGNLDAGNPLATER